ncbi:hypothetical protein VTK73DRAFT_1464 [Phialemonium thermophilum]|uniref:BZIP domain-containing protein n=1 Tax=Phialemonium thermophilum TaxID=223376 RepID=A0ABR3X9W0_9PEZI
MSTSSMSTSPATTTAALSQSGIVDSALDSFIDFSEYENLAYNSPSLSPTNASKSAFVSRAVKQEATPASLLSTSQPLSGPSHQYDLYKQQTGIVPGALASTLAVNQSAQVQGYTDYNFDYMGLGNTDDVFDFNTTPQDTDMDYEASDAFLFGDSTVNPSSIGGQEPSNLASSPVFSSQTSNVGRLWPGMHQQAAMARAQAQQRQRQLAQQQQQQQQRQQQALTAQTTQSRPTQRSKSSQPTDPIVEQKITQLLNSMRAKPATSERSETTPPLSISRPKKDEEDMDEDERLLASEEGKKLSSKERRQLRNKVSARAFRSRRKEYISQLEAEIQKAGTENGDLRAQNAALIEENKRLSDLTRTLLSSKHFSSFLEEMASNPQELAVQPQAAPQPQTQSQQQSRDVPKDVNPFAAQQIGMAMIPDRALDFSNLTIEPAEAFNFQPQVYAVLETTEPTTIETSILSGKTSNFVGEYHDIDEEKLEMPILETAPPASLDEKNMAEIFSEVSSARSVSDHKSKASLPAPVVDEEFETDPSFALYHDTAATKVDNLVAQEPVEIDTEAFSHVDIFGGIEPDKALARFELVDATEEEATAALAMAKVQRINASLESVVARLEMLTAGL